MCCGTRVRGSVPQPQSSSLALPCQILVSVDGCQSLAAFGSCIHWMRAPSRRPITPAGTVGKRVPSGHNRRRRLATRRCDTKRAGTTAVVPATIEWQQCLLHLHFFDTLKGALPIREALLVAMAYFSSRLLPVISAGTAMPMLSSMVGAMSASRPPVRSLRPIIYGPTAMKGTGLVV